MAEGSQYGWPLKGSRGYSMAEGSEVTVWLATQKGFRGHTIMAGRAFNSLIKNVQNNEKHVIVDGAYIQSHNGTACQYHCASYRGIVMTGLFRYQCPVSYRRLLIACPPKL